MKYLSVDRLQDFEFHDSEMQLAAFSEEALCVSMRALNIHRGTPQNEESYDMEIAEAIVTFSGFQILSFDPHGEDGEPVYTETNGHAKLLEALGAGITLYDLDRKDDGTYFFDALDHAPRYPYFTVHFTFASVSVAWDQYCGKAWYESEAFRQYRATQQ